MNALTQSYVGHGFSIQYPGTAALFESERSDNTFLVRVLDTLENTKHRYDIEKFSGNVSASGLAKSFFRHPIPQPEDVAPEAVTLNGMTAWHARKVLLEGLHAVLICDAVFLDWNQGVMRFQFLAYSREFSAGLPAFEALVRSFVSVTQQPA